MNPRKQRDNELDRLEVQLSDNESVTLLKIVKVLREEIEDLRHRILELEAGKVM